MRRALRLVAAALCGALFPLFAHGIPITAHVTADNHYGLYYGQADGTSLTFVGRNEVGTPGNPGTNNWSLPETWNFNAPAGNYLYIVAWDSGAQQMWLGDFAWPGHMLVSNTTDWQYVTGGTNPGDGGAVPPLVTLQAQIAAASWLTPGASAAQPFSPWGSIPGIDSSADYVWSDTLSGATTASDSHYLIFRTAAPLEAAAAPAPATFALLGLGLAAMGFARRREVPAAGV